MPGTGRPRACRRESSASSSAFNATADVELGSVLLRFGVGIGVEPGESADVRAAAVVVVVVAAAVAVAVVGKVEVEVEDVGIRGLSTGATASAPNCASRNMRRRASFSGGGREVLACGLCCCCCWCAFIGGSAASADEKESECECECECECEWSLLDSVSSC